MKWECEIQEEMADSMISKVTFSEFLFSTTTLKKYCTVTYCAIFFRISNPSLIHSIWESYFSLLLICFLFCKGIKSSTCFLEVMLVVYHIITNWSTMDCLHVGGPKKLFGIVPL